MVKFQSVSVNGMIVRGPNVGIVFFFYNHPVYKHLYEIIMIFSLVLSKYEIIKNKNNF